MEPKEARSVLSKYLQHKEIPGISAAWLESSGGLQAVALGHADAETGELLTPAHRMPAGSVGKTFAAATALRLVAESKLDLDEPIRRWHAKDNYVTTIGHFENVSLRMLLGHTSGIPDHRVSPRFAEALQSQLCRDTPNCDLYFDPQTLLGFVSEQPATCSPGSGFEYTETGYILAGMMIEWSGGAPYYELVRRYYLGPLNLNNTIPADRREISRLAQGYIQQNDTGFPRLAVADGRFAVNPATEWAGGGFVSTASDLALWAHKLFTGQALESKYVNEMLTCAQPTGDPDVEYGLGCYRWRTDAGLAFGHSGETPGYRSIMAHYPEHNLAVAVQINSSRIPHSILREILGRFARQLT